MCRVVSRGLGELNSKLGSIIDAFVGTTLVVAGLLFLLFINSFIAASTVLINKLLYVKQLSTTQVDTLILL